MIVAFTGAKGSGKDFAGSIVAETHNLSVKSFADPIRHRVKAIFQLESDAEYDEFKRSEHRVWGNVVHGREIVRGLGMAMRDVNENFPLEYMDQFNDQDIVITDLRFDNELEWCRRNNVIVIKVVDACAEAKADDHISERGFEDGACDATIFNYKDDSFCDNLLSVLQIVIHRKLTQVQEW